MSETQPQRQALLDQVKDTTDKVLEASSSVIGSLEKLKLKLKKMNGSPALIPASKGKHQ